MDTVKIRQNICPLISIEFPIVVIDMSNLTTITRNQNSFCVKSIGVDSKWLCVTGEKRVYSVFVHRVCI